MIFQESMPLLYPTDMFFIDMAKLDKNSMTYFYPIYAGEQILWHLVFRFF